MTEKQFRREAYAIYEKGNPICMTLRNVDKRLNELWEENEQLKEEIHLNLLEIESLKPPENPDKSHQELLKSCSSTIERLTNENEQLKKQIERIDFILDDLNGAKYISRDDGIKALNKIDKVIGKGDVE